MIQTLDSLLRSCTVKLNTLSNNNFGSGFFITPNLVITCAHVIKDVELSSVQALSFEQDIYFKFTKKYSFDQFDLVLLQVDGNILDFPCVLIGDEFLPGDPLYIYGYTDDFPKGSSVTSLCEGLAIYDDIPLIKFKAGQIRPGLSGSPLLNQRTGKVCGIVKFTRDRSIDLGGGAISATVCFSQFNKLLDAQREFHKNKTSWTNLLPTETQALNETNIRHRYLESILSEEQFKRWAAEKYISENVHPLPMNVAPQSLCNSEDAKRTVRDLTEVVEECFIRKEQVLILGDPGAGKTTALERLVYLYACQGLSNMVSPLPILIPLNRYISNIIFVIQAEVSKICNFNLSEEQALSLLNKTIILFLFDGLNELGESRAEDIRFICNFMRANPQHYYVITCRTQDFHNEIEVPELWQIEPIKEEDIEHYLIAYLEIKGRLLFDEIRKDKRLLTLAQNPLMLRMIKDAGEAGSLPKNRGELYKTFVKKMLWREQQKGSKSHTIPGQIKERILAQLAYKMQQDTILYCGDRYIKDSFSEYLKDWDEPYNWRNLLKEIEINGLLFSVGNGWTFMHQSIQEFFAALELEENLVDLLDDVVGKPNWNEVLLLLSGVTNQSSFLVKRMTEIDLFMSVKSVIHGAKLDQDLFSILISKLGKISQSENWAVRRTCADLMGELGSSLAHSYLIKLLRDINTEVRWGAIHAIRLIKIGGSDIIDALLPLLKDNFWIAQKDNFWVCQGEAAMTIGEIGTIELFPQLVTLLESSYAYVRISATYALVKLGINSSTPGLAQYLSHAPKNTQILTEFAIQTVASNMQTSFIRASLKNESPLVREASLMLLVRERERLANSDIIELLKDKFSSVRSAAVAALGKLQGKQFIQEIVDLAFNDLEEEVRSSAVGALDSLHSHNTVPYLLRASKDTSPTVRAVVVLSLGRLRSIESRDVLKDLAQSDPDINVRIHAIRAIGFIAVSEDRNYLIDLLYKEKEHEIIQSINEAIDNILRGERRLRF